MKKLIFIFNKIISKTIIYFLVSLMLVAPITVKANTASDLQQQIDVNRALLNQKSREANTLQNQIAVFDGQIRDAELQVQRTRGSIANNQAEITKLQDQIKQKEDELKIQKENLFETMKTMYETGSDQSMVEIVASSNTLSDLIDKSQYLESISSNINKTVDSMKKIKADMETSKNEQEQKKKESEDLLVQQKSYSDSLDGQKAAKDQLLAQTKGQESEYQKNVTDLQRTLNAIYNSGKGSPVGSDLISSIDGGWYYNQNDYPGTYISGYSLASIGCLVTSIAMVATKYGHRISPPKVVDVSYFSDGYWISSPNIGISVGSTVPVNWGRVNSELDQGHPVILGVSVPGRQYNGNFNHFIVAYQIRDGKYLIHDPYWRDGSYSTSDVKAMKIVTN